MGWKTCHQTKTGRAILPRNKTLRLNTTDSAVSEEASRSLTNTLCRCKTHRQVQNTGNSYRLDNGTHPPRSPQTQYLKVANQHVFCATRALRSHMLTHRPKRSAYTHAPICAAWSFIVLESYVVLFRRTQSAYDPIAPAVLAHMPDAARTSVELGFRTFGPRSSGLSWTFDVSYSVDESA